MNSSRISGRTATGLLLSLTACVALLAAPAAALPRAPVGPQALGHARPWVEGVDPALENALFAATYSVLPAHNVLKVYAFAAGGYESAGVRFSARVPHEDRDLTAKEIAREAVILIRTTFDDFPEVQEVDIWGTVPVATVQMKSVENTVFSISANREIYAQLTRQPALSDEFFLGAFGRVWMAPQVPR